MSVHDKWHSEKGDVRSGERNNPGCHPASPPYQEGSLEETKKEPPGKQLQGTTGWGQFQEDRGVTSTWVDKDKA